MTSNPGERERFILLCFVFVLTNHLAGEGVL